MKIKQKDFDPARFRKLFSSWTSEQKENYSNDQKSKLDFERGQRGRKIEALLEQ